MGDAEIVLKLMEIMGEPYIRSYCDQHQVSVVDAFDCLVDEMNRKQRAKIDKVQIEGEKNGKETIYI